MTLQEFIAFDQFVRCYCIGQEEVMIMPYDPTKSYLSGEQYITIRTPIAGLAVALTSDVRDICRALARHHTSSLRLRTGVPYAIAS